MSQEMNTAAASFAQALAHVHAHGNHLATDVQAASAQGTLNNHASQLVEVEQQLLTLQQAFVALRRRFLVEVRPSLEGRGLVDRVLIGVFTLTNGTAKQKVKLDAAGKAAGGLSPNNVLSVANQQKPDFFEQANDEVALTEAGVAAVERIIFGGN